MGNKKKAITVVSNERKRIQNFEQGLLNTGNRVDEVISTIIKSSTNDGKTISLGDLDPEIASTELYQEFVDMGVATVEKKEITVTQSVYKAKEIYADHFVRSGNGIKIKASSLLLIDNLFLDKARANIKEKKGN